MERKGFMVLVLVLVSIFLITSAPQAEQKFLRMFSGPEGGSWYPLGSAMMGIVEKVRGSPHPTAPAAAWATARPSTEDGPTWAGPTPTQPTMPTTAAANLTKKMRICDI
jgi:hypothetical protein